MSDLSILNDPLASEPLAPSAPVPVQQFDVQKSLVVLAERLKALEAKPSAPSVDDFIKVLVPSSGDLTARVAALEARARMSDQLVANAAVLVAKHDRHLEQAIRYIESVVDCLRVSMGGVWARFNLNVLPPEPKEHLPPVDGRPL